MIKKLAISVILIIITINSIAFGYSTEINSIKGYGQVSVSSGTLNLRSKPEKNATVKEYIPNGAIIAIIEDLDTWLYVYSVDVRKYGYVMSQFVKSVFPDTTTLMEGCSGKQVLNLKERMQELGYFRSYDDEISAYFSTTTEERLILLQEVNGFEQDGIASPELISYIYWGPCKKFKGVLPQAPYFVAQENYTQQPTQGTTTSDVTPLTISVSSFSNSNITSSTTVDGESIYTIVFSYKYNVTGGVLPYTITADVWRGSYHYGQIRATGYFQIKLSSNVGTYSIQLCATDYNGNKATSSKVSVTLD